MINHKQIVCICIVFILTLFLYSDLNAQYQSPWGEIKKTTDNHSILITKKFGGEVLLNGKPIKEGDWIGVFYNDTMVNKLVCFGAGQWQEDQQGAGIAAWGDNKETKEVEGFRPGDEFIFKAYVPSTDTFCDSISVSYYKDKPYNDKKWKIDGILIITNFIAECK